ncbi:hypothetical protein CSPX01_11992 [Colletotrichum filicis]|nr:hypothetical protein CSPX01_11992 [Colletotrichum filicis]
MPCRVGSFFTRLLAKRRRTLFLVSVLRRSPRISSGLPSCHYTIAQCFVTTLEREPVPLTREFTVQRLCAGDEGYISPTPHATASTYNHHGPSRIR